MGSALAAIATVVVGVLVFLNSRLEVGDRRKSLLTEAEILSKLTPDSKQHDDMQTVVNESIADYRDWQRSRRGSRERTRVIWGVGLGVTTTVVSLNAPRWFDLGSFAPLVNLIGWTAAGVVIGLFINAPGILFRR